MHIGLARRVGFVVVAIALAAGCSADAGNTDNAPADDVVLRVVDGSAVARDWTLDELQQELSFAEVVVDGDAQTGPRLIDVIAASGIDGWETGQVLGMSEGRVIEVGLGIESSEVDETWVFDVTKRDTLKLAAPDLPRQQWVRDVGEIRFP